MYLNAQDGMQYHIRMNAVILPSHPLRLYTKISLFFSTIKEYKLSIALFTLYMLMDTNLDIFLSSSLTDLSTIKTIRMLTIIVGLIFVTGYTRGLLEDYSKQKQLAHAFSASLDEYWALRHSCNNPDMPNIFIAFASMGAILQSHVLITACLLGLLIHIFIVYQLKKQAVFYLHVDSPSNEENIFFGDNTISIHKEDINRLHTQAWNNYVTTLNTQESHSAWKFLISHEIVKNWLLSYKNDEYWGICVECSNNNFEVAQRLYSESKDKKIDTLEIDVC